MGANIPGEICPALRDVDPDAFNVADEGKLVTYFPSSNHITRTSGTPFVKDLIGGILVQGSGLSSGWFENDVFSFNEIPGETIVKGYGIPASGLHSSHGTHCTLESMAFPHDNRLSRGFGLPDGANIEVDRMNRHQRPEDNRDVLHDRPGNQFANARFQDIAANIPSLCRDQRGCCYLQKKLGEEIPEYRDVIFYNIIQDFADLMKDPIGKYLCLKLLELMC
ncbi:hypothetical protein D9757_014682 [Collybiopsis confluens]|uniref:PUM-HD domain-containing protein n=1 Tax=Collybiopsis confluens TaxID=2823264 RepID=A0A8H5FTK8_9AGAR|nr:hypothetical protein D9757_014682 [Collybiopsis confluens]